MPVRIAINGFGRIGRAVLKIALENPNLEIVGINDLTDVKILSYLLNYDTAYGEYPRLVSAETDGIVTASEAVTPNEEYLVKPTEAVHQNFLVIDRVKIPVFSEKDPAHLPWADLNVEVVLECTGVFTDFEKARVHLQAGAKKVIISAPGKGEGATLILGTSSTKLEEIPAVVSNGSCTTNCVAPIMSLLTDKFGVRRSWLTTIHSYTADQSLVDGGHPKDIRRGRAAAANIIPTTTGAAQSVTAAVPALKGLFEGTAIRVPTLVVSLSVITAFLEKKTTLEEVNELFLKAAESTHEGLITTTVEPLVSSDYIKNPSSAILSLDLTNVVEGDFVTLFAWYDNEWGYANRLVDLALKMGGAQRE